MHPHLLAIQPRPSRPRRWVLGVVLWAFGIATSTLLVGVWGRSVTSSPTVVANSVQAMVDAGAASEQIGRWIDALAGETTDGQTDDMVDAIASSPEAQAAIAALVDEFMTATTIDGQVDVAPALDIIRPRVVNELARRGIELPDEAIDRVLAGIGPLVLETQEETGVVTAIAPVRTVLTVVLLTGIAGLIGFGSLAVWLSEDRIVMARSLAHRLAVSAFTFFLFLRIGAWASDPARGRTPLRAVSFEVLTSQGHVVLALMAVGIAGSWAGSWAIARRRRRRAEHLQDDPELEVPVPV